MSEPSTQQEVRDILLKEYDTMRTEVRMYINKLYLSLTAILGIITAGIFRGDPRENGFVYIFIPFIVSGIIAFMSVVTFFINKTAGYIRLIEQRINRIYGTTSPVQHSQQIDSSSFLAPLIWESFYADLALERDQARQLKSVFAFPLIVFIVIGALSLAIVIKYGLDECLKHGQFAGWAYLFLSSLCLYLAPRGYMLVNTNVRRITMEVNAELMQAYIPIECHITNEGKENAAEPNDVMQPIAHKAGSG